MKSFVSFIVLLAILASSFAFEDVPPLAYPLANPNRMRFEKGVDIETAEAARMSFQSPDFRENDDNPFKHSGHVTTNTTVGSHYFYLFFEALNGDTSAPVILWLNGGPGCSSLNGALMENLSPYSVSDNVELVKNNRTWTEKYNMLFIDNPVNTGFSYSVKNHYVRDMDEMAQHLYTALIEFFKLYGQYANNDFYIAGESFAGAYIPSIATKIQQEGYKINLKGVAIGNGLTAPNVQLATYSDMAYSSSLIDENDRVNVERYERECKNAISNRNWSAATSAWGSALSIVQRSGVNIYDMRMFGSYDDAATTRYLNLPSVQKMMHTEGHHWELCDGPVYSYLQNQIPQSNEHKVVSLLNEGRIKVLLFNGNMDGIIPTSGAQHWIYDMEWKGKAGFNDAKRQIWKSHGVIGGYVTKHLTLTQLSFRNAGHMVPMDQTPISLEMIDRFLVEG